MKNCDPFPSGPAFAIDNNPGSDDQYMYSEHRSSMLTIVSFLEVLIGELTVNTFAQLRQSRTYLGAINTLSTSPIMSLEITSLDHEPRNDPMEGSTLVPEPFG